jgi:hypothetical protein
MAAPGFTTLICWDFPDGERLSHRGQSWEPRRDVGHPMEKHRSLVDVVGRTGCRRPRGVHPGGRLLAARAFAAGRAGGLFLVPRPSLPGGGRVGGGSSP